MAEDLTFRGKIRRVISDLKEPKDGTDRVVTLVTLSSDSIPPNIARRLLTMQAKGELDFTVTTAQGEIDLGANGSAEDQPAAD